MSSRFNGLPFDIPPEHKDAFYGLCWEIQECRKKERALYKAVNRLNGEIKAILRKKGRYTEAVRRLHVERARVLADKRKVWEEIEKLNERKRVILDQRVMTLAVNPSI